MKTQSFTCKNLTKPNERNCLKTHELPLPDLLAHLSGRAANVILIAQFPFSRPVRQRNEAERIRIDFQSLTENSFALSRLHVHFSFVFPSRLYAIRVDGCLVGQHDAARAGRLSHIRHAAIQLISLFSVGQFQGQFTFQRALASER